MLDKDDQILYVGKAKSLRNRVSSYLSKGVNKKTSKLMEQVHKIDCVLTNTEFDALLLEHNLIKTFKPKFNILLKDDKSFYYIKLELNHDFPQLSIVKAKITTPTCQLYGPYVNKTAVTKVIDYLQKIFKLRECNDAFFKNRTRACLLYQINRCSASCVGLINKSDYQYNAGLVSELLSGKAQKIINKITNEMNYASDELKFELAAQKRDLIENINILTKSQIIYGLGGDYDVVGMIYTSTKVMLEVFTVRAGKIIANDRRWFAHSELMNKAEMIENILIQYYLLPNNILRIPKEIICCELQDSEFSAKYLSIIAKTEVKVINRTHGKRAKILQMIAKNMNHSFQVDIKKENKYKEGILELDKLLHLDAQLHRIECIDISHIAGKHTVGSVVVYDNAGHVKSDDRRYYLSNDTNGNDLKAIQELLLKRYSKLRLVPDKLPNILIIDGGRDQLNIGVKVLKNMGLYTLINVVSISKGEARKVGNEYLHLSNASTPLFLAKNPLLFPFLVTIRDEAHSLAIRAHRKRRAKETIFSILDSIEGIGRKKKKSLIEFLGGIKTIRDATEDDLTNVPGISKILAKRIYGLFHDG